MKTKLKQARIEAQLTQRGLAAMIDRSDKAISAYEAGRTKPPLEVLKKISRSTGKPVSYFLGDKEVTNEDILTKLGIVGKILEQIKNYVRG